MAGKPQLELIPGVGDRIVMILRQHPTIGTATALGAAADLSRQTLHRALNENTLTRETARAIAKALGVSLDRILAGERVHMVREELRPHSADERSTEWHTTNPLLARRLPPAAYKFVYDRLKELSQSGLAEEQILVAEQFFLNDTFAQINAHKREPMTEADWMKKVRADWMALKAYLADDGVAS